MSNRLHGKNAKTIPIGIACVDAIRLPGWDPRDSPKQPLGAIGDLAPYRSH